MTPQKRATVVASITSTLLIFLKLAIGIVSGSVAVLASAVDSVLDLIVSLFNFFAVHKAEQPADSQFNYGRGKIEALAAVIEGTVITLSGLFIFYEAVHKALTHGGTRLLGPSILVMVLSLIITIALVLYLNRVAKQTGNMVIKSDALHYKTDIYSNGAILLALVLVRATGLEIIDALMGAAIALYIIYSAYELIKEGVYVLLDGALEEEIVEGIKTILENEKGITGYHFLKTRRSGNVNFVDVHLVFTPESSLLEAHRVSDRVEEQIKRLDTQHAWIINIHLDPYDDSEINEEELPHTSLHE